VLAPATGLLLVIFASDLTKAQQTIESAGGQIVNRSSRSRAVDDSDFHRPEWEMNWQCGSDTE